MSAKTIPYTPRQALRVVVSHAATEQESGKARREVVICEVRRVYFYAKISRDIYIELPEEDLEHGRNPVGKLRLCLRCGQELAGDAELAF